MDSNKQTDEFRSDEAFAKLLGGARPRPAPPEADEALIREAVHAEWRKVSGERIRWRRIGSFAIAASVMLAVFASLNLLRDPAADFRLRHLASLQKQFGEVSVNDRVVSGSQLAAVERGDSVSTGAAAGLALG